MTLVHKKYSQNKVHYLYPNNKVIYIFNGRFSSNMFMIYQFNHVRKMTHT